MKSKVLLVAILLLTLSSACTLRTAAPPPLQNSAPAVISSTSTPQIVTLPTNTPSEQPVASTATQSPSPAPTTQPTQTPVLNPLTGLPVEDPSLLMLSPALVSVSNFPVSVRPQSGLSYSPHVFEMTIGEGMTRFLAIYYGDYGKQETANVGLGSVRSGRLPYEQLRNMYDGFIIMAGASPEVTSQLGATHFRETVNFETIKSLAEDRVKSTGAPTFGRLVFDGNAPANGLQGNLLNITWSDRNRVRWNYDPATGKYLREQDKSDGSGKMFPATDKLTGGQLAFDNVVVMAAEHDWQTPTRIAINLLYVVKEPAIFFRDGKAYPVYWTSLSPLGPFRFINPDGSNFPYKPGNTWYEIIQSINEIKQIEDQSWFVRFVTPK